MPTRDLPLTQHARVTNGFAESIDDLRGSARIAFSLVFTWDAMVGVLVALGSTAACWLGGLGDRGHDASGAISTMLSLVIVFPITTLIAMAFSRRDRALAAYAVLVGELQATCGASCAWRRRDADGKWIRLIEGTDASDRVVGAYEAVLDATARYCATPRSHRTRYELASYGTEQSTLVDLSRQRKLDVGAAIQACRRLNQQLKVDGLPGGESHRLDSYLAHVAGHFEEVSALKEYRTPAGARAIARVSVLWHGVFAGPWYASLAIANSGPALGLIYALAMQLAFNALLQVALGLEDPFVREGGRGVRDSVRVWEIADTAREGMRRTAREASLPWYENMEPRRMDSLPALAS